MKQLFTPFVFICLCVALILLTSAGSVGREPWHTLFRFGGFACVVVSIIVLIWNRLALKN